MKLYVHLFLVPIAIHPVALLQTFQCDICFVCQSEVLLNLISLFPDQ